jgi:FkbM family methyltransferase
LIIDTVHVPHLGWFRHEKGDQVAAFLREGWYEYREQAFFRLYLRPGDTFIDGGAHFGLFSVLAWRATGGQARVIAVEPNPRTVPLLRANLGRRKAGDFAIEESALFSEEGPRRFYPQGESRSSYSGLQPLPDGGDGIEVACTTLDALRRKHRLDRVELVKIDLEGAEIDALRGAREGIAAAAFPVIMVEFTELNMQRFGRRTADLFQELESLGYQVCRFEENGLRLRPVSYSGPIGYDNLFAVRDLEPVAARLRGAPARHRAIARDIVRRGAAVAALQREGELCRRRLDSLLSRRYVRLGAALRLIPRFPPLERH